MGIPGLTTYIANRSEQYLEPFELHDTYLVIDGNSIACQLYNWYAKCNCAFGGDYDKYAQCVRDFFQGLRECNIEPLVLFDGGIEDKKLQTIMKRSYQKMQAAASYTPLNQNNLKLLPSLLSQVFRSTVKEMGIRRVQCLFEADNAIAAVAKFLNCPVLSYDSDFYIYGSLYIPFDTMDIHVTRKWRTNVKCCKIYRVTALLNTFPGLNESMLPLAAVLLGNDYIQQNVFKNFFQHMKMPKVGRLNHNQQQCRIEATLSWLSRHTLNSAIATIISRIPKQEKKQIVSNIKMIMNEYTNVSTNILIPLGFSQENIAHIISQNMQNNCSEQTDTNYLKLVEELESTFQMINQNEDINKSTSETECEAFVNSLPSWFINEFYKGLLPSYFIDILMRELCICSSQIEDYSRPSSIFISEKIMNVIFTLLKSGFEKTNECGQYITRGPNNDLTRYSLQYINNIFSCKVPSLQNLREVPMIIRKEIMNITLGVQQYIDEFPVNWKLYIATAKYWADHLTELRSDSHIYALLFTILHHVIDVKIGYFRSMSKFKNKYKKMLKELESKKKNACTSVSYSTDMSITQALNAIEIEDCLLLAPFFICNSEMDEKLYTNPKSFKVAVVHIFAQLQTCIKYSYDLNLLLGFPYEVTLISDMFNGTLLYNLYNNFQGRKNIEDYINFILQPSPTLLQLFNIILIKAKSIFKLRAIKKKTGTSSTCKTHA